MVSAQFDNTFASMSVLRMEKIHMAILFLPETDGSGWVTCQLNGLTPGLIPASYIEIEQFYEAPSEAVPIQKGNLKKGYFAP